jgi:hypothetical protein
VVRRAVIALVTWALLFGVWMLLVDNDTLAEVLTGTGASALAAVGSELVRAQRIAEVRIRPRWLARAWRPLAWAALFGDALRGRVPPLALRASTRSLAELQLHSGHVGDYVAWLTFGLATLGGLCAVTLR